MASVTQEAEQCEEGDDDVFYVTNGRTNTNHSNTNGAGERVKTIDRYGFIIGANISSATPTTNGALPRMVYMSRERKWLNMFSNWDYWMSKKFFKVKERCRKGIPDSVRAQAWQYLSRSTYFQTDASSTYQIYLKQQIDAKVDTEIKNDLHRSFPSHCMFADNGGVGQQNLYNVLRAYTAYNPSEGYCQAHAPLVSVLLMHMAEEQAFWCLVAMLDNYLKGYYGGQLEEVGNDGATLLNLLHIVHPKLHKRMLAANIDAPLFMVEWFMCLFARDLPWPSVLRIWDIFFCEGVKILFRVALVLLRHCTAHLSKIPRELYELLSCLKIKNMPREILQAEFLITEAFKLPIKDSDMSREHKKVVRQKIKKSKSAQSSQT